MSEKFTASSILQASQAFIAATEAKKLPAQAKANNLDLENIPSVIKLKFIGGVVYFAEDTLYE